MQGRVVSVWCRAELEDPLVSGAWFWWASNRRLRGSPSRTSETRSVEVVTRGSVECETVE